MIFLTLVGRPVSVAALLAGFRASIGQMGLVSWAGLRGVASIVFAIYVVLRQVPLGYNLFNLVFLHCTVVHFYPGNPASMDLRKVADDR